MACKIWSKGIKWKSTAVKFLGDMSSPLPNIDNDRRGFSTVGFQPIGFPASHKTGLRFRPSTFRPSLSSFCGARSFHSTTSSPYKAFTVTDYSATGPSIQTRGSSSGSGQSSEGSGTTFAAQQDPGAPKVGIISSMFDDGQTKESANKEEEQENKEDKEEKEKKESQFLRSQRIAKWVLLGTFAVSTPMLIMEFGPPRRDEMGDIIVDEFSNDPVVLAYLKRSWNAVKLYEKDIVEPSSQKLLPDPLREPYYQPPYTLVIELFDVLLHPVYDQIHGWRFKKRPGIDYFLQTIGPPMYEIVIFTRETGMTAFPLIDSMDPKGYIMYRLFRDAARFKSGFNMGNVFKGELPTLDPYYQKDLTYLNRDLKRVVLVDNDKRSTELQPNNGISLKPWDGSSTDTELYDLAAFLHAVATNEVDDVRPVLEHYRKYEDPLAAFKLAQVRMQQEQERLAKELQENKSKPFALRSQSSGMGLLTRFFGSKN